MILRIFSLFLLLVWFASCKKKRVPVQNPSSFSFTIPALSKGINLSNWFNDYSDAAQYSTRFTSTSFQQIKVFGFTYVRIPIGNTILYNKLNPSQLHQLNLQKVDAGINAAINAGLGVTINIHPWKNEMDSLLSADPSEIVKVATYWKAVASFFKKYPSDKLFFEVYNEPHASAAGLTNQPKTWWQNVQEKMIQAIRSETLDHSVIVGGEGWNNIEGLTLLQPYNYQKLIYNFHFYDPFLFTHQGASWAGWPPAVNAGNVPYPSTPDNVALLITQAGSQDLKDALSWYGSQRYTIDSLNKWVLKAVNWAKQNNLLLICNEFGSYKTYAPRKSRLNYINDMRTVLEQNNIGWAMWEFDEGFGIVDYTGGNRNAPYTDTDLLKSLGLK